MIRLLPEDTNRIQSPECCVLNKKWEDGCKKIISPPL
jgi:hypothetical protein